MEIPEDVKKECEALSVSLGLSSSEVMKAVQDLVSTHGYNPYGAMAVYKSIHKRELSGVKGVYKIIPLHIGDVVPVKGMDGKPDSEVVHVLGMCNLLKSEEFYLTDLSLWGVPSDQKRIDRTKLAKTLVTEGVFEFDGSYNPTTKKMSMLGTEFRPLSGISVDMKTLLAGVSCIPLSSAEDMINDAGFYTGYVGRVFNTDNAGMVEVSSQLATPISCWFNNMKFDEADMIGKSVVMLAVSSKPKDKEVRLNGKAIWVLQ